MAGLHIIGTERHEARRIDNQLRGRAGCQGDPGTTRFFLSLEDSLMRIFGGDKIAWLMEFLRADEEIPIEHNMVSKSIEGAQKKVEAHHFDTRKAVLQYDDVLNTQREVIYRERRRILERADLKESIESMLEEHLDIILGAHIDSSLPPEVWHEAGLPEALQVLAADIPMLSQVRIDELSALSFEDLRNKLLEDVYLAYKVREEHLSTEIMRELERQILLQTIDSKWVDYLHNIDLLREGIHLRGYGQRDPLQEYKREAFEMFNQLLRSIQQESISMIFRAQPMFPPPPEEFLTDPSENPPSSPGGAGSPSAELDDQDQELQEDQQRREDQEHRDDQARREDEESREDQERRDDQQRREDEERREDQEHRDDPINLDAQINEAIKQTQKGLSPAENSHSTKIEADKH